MFYLTHEDQNYICFPTGCNGGPSAPSVLVNKAGTGVTLLVS